MITKRGIGKAFITLRNASIPLGLLQAVAFAHGWVRVQDVPHRQVVRVLHLTAVLGVALRVWCYRTLQKYFTFQLSIQKEHQVRIRRVRGSQSS